jgi:hypothetical protein
LLKINHCCTIIDRESIPLTHFVERRFAMGTLYSSCLVRGLSVVTKKHEGRRFKIESCEKEKVRIGKERRTFWSLTFKSEGGENENEILETVIFFRKNGKWCLL